MSANLFFLLVLPFVVCKVNHDHFSYLNCKLPAVLFNDSSINSITLNYSPIHIEKTVSSWNWIINEKKYDSGKIVLIQNESVTLEFPTIINKNIFIKFGAENGKIKLYVSHAINYVDSESCTYDCYADHDFPINLEYKTTTCGHSELNDGCKYFIDRIILTVDDISYNHHTIFSYVKNFFWYSYIIFIIFVGLAIFYEIITIKLNKK